MKTSLDNVKEKLARLEKVQYDCVEYMEYSASAINRYIAEINEKIITADKSTKSLYKKTVKTLERALSIIKGAIEE